MQLYVYKLSLLPKYHSLENWDAAAQSAVKNHADYLQEAVKSGKVLMVGRSDTDLKDNFGLCVFKAENQEEADAFAAADPVLKGNIMTAVVFPFKLLVVKEEALKFNIW